ncbi:MAG: hypothetical protein ABIM74_09145 [candidate division WOR-3 bacterium]
MKKALAVVGLALGLAYATETRVMTMGNEPQFLQDEFLVLYYPSVITQVSSMYLFELGDVTLAPRYAGVFWTGGEKETGRQGLGLYLRRNTLLEGVPPTYPQPKMGFGLIGGKSFGSMSFGAGVYYSQEADKEELDTTFATGFVDDTANVKIADDFKTSNMTFMLGGTLNYGTGSFADLSVGYAMHGYNSTHTEDGKLIYIDPDDSTQRLDKYYYKSWEESDGASSMLFSLRAFHFLNEKFALVPAFGYRMDNYSTVTPDDTSYEHWVFPDSSWSDPSDSRFNLENKGTIMGFGLGFNIYPTEGMTIMAGIGGSMLNWDHNLKYKHDTAATDSTYTDTLENTSVKKIAFVTGAEVPVFTWLSVRGAMKKTLAGNIVKTTTLDYHDARPSDKRTETTTIPDDFQFWVGLGIRVGSFRLDGNLDPMFLYYGFYGLGGNASTGFLNVSAAYQF